jgi:uncharacterized protein
MSDRQPSPFSASGAAFPGRAPIDAYGNGGFRFAEMSHKGSILCLPEGTFAWDVTEPDELSLDHLRPIMAALAPPAFLLLGTGERQVFPPFEVRRAFLDAGIGLEPMDTGAACRTFNVLLAEERPVAAALIAVT